VRAGIWRAALVTALALVCACGDGAPMRRRVRADGRPGAIVLIVVDTLRRDFVSAYGGRVPTPNIDRLATEGTRVDGAVSSFHQTTMSMAALFTGRTPSLETGTLEEPLGWTGSTWCGMARFDDGGPCVRSDLPTMAEALQREGYRTVGIVSNPLLFEPAGYARGFDDWVQVGAMRRGSDLEPTRAELRSRAAPAVLAAAAAALARAGDQPLFLYVHFMDVHDYFADGDYGASVAATDAAIGELRELLAAHGGLDDTVIVLTADHGERFDEAYVIPGMRAHYGNPSFESVLDVPLVVWPRTERKLQPLMRGEDVYDLVLALAGVKSAREPLLEPYEQLVSEQRFVTYRRGRWKSFFNRKTERLVLIDLEQDPREQRDVAAEHPDIALTHRVRIQTLGEQLAAKAAEVAPLSEDDRLRLRALGYLE